MQRGSFSTTMTVTTTTTTSVAVPSTQLFPKEKGQKTATLTTSPSPVVSGLKTTTSSSTATKTSLAPPPPAAAAAAALPGGGLLAQQTFWQQELHRYYPSGWMLVRIAGLMAYPYLACVLSQHVWPLFVAYLEDNDLNVEISSYLAMMLVSNTVFVAHNAFYGLVYYFEPAFLKRYRVDDKPWHWEEKAPAAWQAMLKKTFGLVLFNMVVVSTSLMMLRVYFIGSRFRFDVASLPIWTELSWQLLFCTVMEDFAFHHVHQLLHTPRFYWIHKVHHHFHAPIGLASIYAHPLEFVFGNGMPALLGPAMLAGRMHFWSVACWVIFRVGATVENHSGYDFPWSLYQAIPFKAPTEYHDFHHHRNVGNYSGTLRIWDWIYGSDQAYFQWVQAGRPATRRKKYVPSESTTTATGSVTDGKED